MKTVKERDYRSCVVLTGAGISQESGIPTFRGADGLWKNFRPEELATMEAFIQDPVLVWEWYLWRRGLVTRARPNRGHETLVTMERGLQRFLLATQNVDGLHRMAGSRNVRELHGSIWRVRCLNGCPSEENRAFEFPELPPRCRCGGILRPDVVWFGEALPHVPWEETVAALAVTDLFLVVGTSLNVAPASHLPLLAKNRGGRLILVNAEPTSLDSLFDEVYHGKAGEVLPSLWGGS